MGEQSDDRSTDTAATPAAAAAAAAGVENKNGNDCCVSQARGAPSGDSVSPGIAPKHRGAGTANETTSNGAYASGAAAFVEEKRAKNSAADDASSRDVARAGKNVSSAMPTEETGDGREVCGGLVKGERERGVEESKNSKPIGAAVVERAVKGGGVAAMEDRSGGAWETARVEEMAIGTGSDLQEQRAREGRNDAMDVEINDKGVEEKKDSEPVQAPKGQAAEGKGSGGEGAEEEGGLNKSHKKSHKKKTKKIGGSHKKKPQAQDRKAQAGANSTGDEPLGEEADKDKVKRRNFLR